MDLVHLGLFGGGGGGLGKLHSQVSAFNYNSSINTRSFFFWLVVHGGGNHYGSR